MRSFVVLSDLSAAALTSSVTMQCLGTSITIGPSRTVCACMMRSRFADKPYADVVNALRSHDDDLAEELDQLRVSLGKRRAGGVRVSDKIIIDAPESVGVEFSTALRTMLVERTTDDWLSWYAAAQQFADREGHSRVPRSHLETVNGAEVKLGAWADKQRTAKKNGTLWPEREGLLEQLPSWVWDLRDASWHSSYEAAWQFSTRNGHARIPHNHVEEVNGRRVKVGQWADKQRTTAKNGDLTEERTRLLGKIPGWVWDLHVASFHIRLDAVRQFAEREGHARIPRSHIETFDGEEVDLGAWAARQRAAEKAGKLDPERKKLLDELPGWYWLQL